jgi:hypothetical protein
MHYTCLWQWQALVDTKPKWYRCCSVCTVPVISQGIRVVSAVPDCLLGGVGACLRASLIKGALWNRKTIYFFFYLIIPVFYLQIYETKVMKYNKFINIYRKRLRRTTFFVWAFMNVGQWRIGMVWRRQGCSALRFKWNGVWALNVNNLSDRNASCIKHKIVCSLHSNVEVITLIGKYIFPFRKTDTTTNYFY